MAQFLSAANLAIKNVLDEYNMEEEVLTELYTKLTAAVALVQRTQSSSATGKSKITARTGTSAVTAATGAAGASAGTKKPNHYAHFFSIVCAVTKGLKAPLAFTQPLQFREPEAGTKLSDAQVKSLALIKSGEVADGATPPLDAAGSDLNELCEQLSATFANSDAMSLASTIWTFYVSNEDKKDEAFKTQLTNLNKEELARLAKEQSVNLAPKKK